MRTFQRHRTPNHPTSGGQSGFTLLELLVVIAVLGVLSGVVVFSVGTMTDTAEETACAADERTLRTAVEAYKVTQGSYGDEADLVAAGLLDSPSSSHDVVLAAGSYSIVPTGDCVSDGAEEIAEGAEEADAPADENADDNVDEPAEREIVRGGRDRGQGGRGPARDRGNEVDLSNGDAASSCARGQVDLNSASTRELTTIAHVNPSTAEEIVRRRPFARVGDLVRRVDGITREHLDQIEQQGKACV